MLLKKGVLLSVALAILPAMTVHAAALVTKNNTAYTSTVKINSAVCVGLLPPGLRVVTKPGETTTVQQDDVNKLCGGKARHVCVADIHLTENCSDKAIGKATFDLDHFGVSTIAMTPGVPYKINYTPGGTYVELNPA